MAELILNTVDKGNREDGDVADCFNRHRIRTIHADVICNVRNAGFNWDGLRPGGTLAQMFLEATSQYRFERAGRTGARRVELATMEEETFGPEPRLLDGRWQAMDVPGHVDWITESDRHAVFGELGKEVWYGGRRDVSDAKLDLVWAGIEAGSELREADHAFAPLGIHDTRHFFAVSVDDFDDATLGELKAPLVDPGRMVDGVSLVVKKRKHKVAWRDLPGLSDSTRDVVLDQGVSEWTWFPPDLGGFEGKWGWLEVVPPRSVDIRAAVQFIRSQIVAAKALG